MKWKLEIEMKLLGKNGIRIEIEIILKMEITLNGWPSSNIGLLDSCRTVGGLGFESRWGKEIDLRRPIFTIVIL